tara:strand:+ start:11 stop:1234 length:1224 start_codon:yes stop_codon:yes gene_type:complete
MSIEIKKIGSVKKVKKPWGYEKWIADGAPNFKYALKEIFFKSGFKSSIQFHEFKEETSYVQNGTGMLYYSTEKINFEKYRNNGYTNEDMQDILNNFHHEELKPGMVYHIKPGTIHRVEAITDLTLIESSTIELEDVIRINDEWGRDDGKINTEHNTLSIPSNFYISQIKRMDLIKENVQGKILFCSYGVNLQYTMSNILLQNNCSEIWHFDFANPKENITIRKLNEKNEIQFTFGPKLDDIPEKTFDSIISSEELSYQKNPQDVITKYYKLLKNSGVLIASTVNSESSIETIETDIQKFGLSKDEFMKLFKKEFSNNKLYSQLNSIDVSHNSDIEDGSISKLRSVAKNFLLKVDPNSNFYKLHLQKTVLKMREKNQKSYSETYVPIPYENTHSSAYFIAICKKSISN